MDWSTFKPIDESRSEFADFDDWSKFVPLANPEPSSLARRVADVPIGLAKGFVDLPSAAVGLGDTFTGGAVSGALKPVFDALGEASDAVGLPAWARPTQWSEQLASLYSRETQGAIKATAESARAAEQQAKDEGDGALGQIGASAWGAIKGIAQNPSAAIPLIAENYGGMKATAMGVAKALKPMAAVLDDAVKAGTMTEAAASKALGDAALKYSAIGEGVLTVGQTGAAIEREDPDASFIRRLAAIPAGVTTAAISRGVGKIPGLGDAEASMATSALGEKTGFGAASAFARMGKGLLSEGLLQEMPQSGQEQAWQNIGASKPWQEGVGESMAQGLVAGTGMGAYAGLMHGATSPEQEIANTISSNVQGSTFTTPASDVAAALLSPNPALVDPATTRQTPAELLNPTPAAAPSPLPTVPTPETPVQYAGFITEKGSQYQLHEDGTTTRNKAARSDVGHEGDSGMKPRTVRTVYIPPGHTASAAGLQGISSSRVIVTGDKLSLLTQTEGKPGVWGRAPSGTDVPFSTTPKVGWEPLELWQPKQDIQVGGQTVEAYGGMHQGNKITHLLPVQQSTPAPEATPAAVLQAPTVDDAIETFTRSVQSRPQPTGLLGTVLNATAGPGFGVDSITQFLNTNGTDIASAPVPGTSSAVDGSVAPTGLGVGSNVNAGLAPIGASVVDGALGDISGLPSRPTDAALNGQNAAQGTAAPTITPAGAPTAVVGSDAPTTGLPGATTTAVEADGVKPDVVEAAPDKPAMTPVDAAKYLKDVVYSLGNLEGVTDSAQIAMSDSFGKSGRDTLLMEAFGITREEAHDINNRLDARQTNSLRSVDMEDAFKVFPSLRQIIDKGIADGKARDERRQKLTRVSQRGSRSNESFLRPEDKYRANLDSAAAELAGQIQENSAEPDFDPKEVPQAIAEWAQQAKVPVDDLRIAVKARLEKIDFRRKAGVLRAINPLNQASTPAPTDIRKIPVSQRGTTDGTQAAQTQQGQSPQASSEGVAVSSTEASKPPLDPLDWNPKKLTEAYDMEQLNVLYKYVQSNYSNPIVGDGPVENGLATSERFNPEGRKIVKALQQAQGVLYERYKAKREADKSKTKDAEPVTVRAEAVPVSSREPEEKASKADVIRNLFKINEQMPQGYEAVDGPLGLGLFKDGKPIEQYQGLSRVNGYDALLSQANRLAGQAETPKQQPDAGDLSKNPEKTNTSAEPVQKTAETAQDKPDLNAMFDDVLAEEVAKDAAASKAKALTRVSQRTATQAAASAVTNTAQALNNAIDGLGALFGGNGRLSSGFTFDEDTYAKAKPLFKAAIANLGEAGRDLKEAMRAVVRMVMDKFGAQTAQNMKPYVVRFIEESQGNSYTDTTSTEAPSTTSKESTNDPTLATPAPTLDSSVAEGQRPAGSEAPARGAQQTRSGEGRGDDGSVRREGQLRDDADNDQGRDADGNGGKNPVGQHEAAGNVAGGLQRVSADYIPGVGGLTRKGSWFETAKRNIDLIELAIKIESENRAATPQEQEQLSKYVGFGASAIRNELFPVPPAYAKAQEPNRLIWPQYVRSDRFKPLAERIEALPREWQETILQSSQYAHYTSEGIIRSVWSALQRMGFMGGNIFEPGMGIGSFAMLMPNTIRNTSRYTGVEFDGPTALIARLLSPDQNMIHGDFIKKRFPKNFFDVNVGNPPFSQTKIFGDPEYAKNGFMLHDFFFAKGIDLVRPGGIQVFVTSKGTMDKLSDKARKYLSDRADLLGAIRLPSTAFEDNAGTSVVTDVIFLRKRAEGEPAGGEAWGKIVQVDTKDGPVMVNEYYAKHPEMVLGQQRISGNTDDMGRRINSNGMGGEKYTVVSYDTTPQELDAKFAQAIEKLPANVYSVMGQSSQAIKEVTAKIDFDPNIKREGVVYLSKDGTLMRVEHGVGKPLDSMVKLSDKDQAWLKDYVGLRNLVQQARFDQLNDGDWEKSLAKLNKAHDAFVKKNGHIRDFRVITRKSTDEDGNVVTSEIRVSKNKRLLSEDYDRALVTVLEDITEDGTIVKAPFLKGRTIGKPVTRDVKTIGDALAVSLDERGTLDLDDVARRMKMSFDEVVDALGTQVYQTPTGEWQLADEYLSGDVVSKLEQAEQAARLNPALKRNLEALKEAQPEKLGPSQISAKLGASWIPESHVNEFAKEIGAGQVTFDPKTESWHVQGGNERNSRNAAEEYGTAKRSPSELLEAILNSRSIKVQMTVDKKVVTDQEGTAAANEVAKKIKDKFKGWVWTDVNRASELVEVYNRNFNNIAPRRFDGSHLTLPGVSLRYKLHPHQLRAIWRMIQTGNTYLAHAVGAGKTIEMIAGGMEQKRLGLIKKPMYVVPNHMLEQFSNEFMELYPLANIMVADDENFSAERRKAFVASATLNNPDAIIITHDAFQRIGVKEESVAPIRDEILSDLEIELSETAKNNDGRVRRSQLQQQIEAVTQRFDKIIGAGQKDSTIKFEDMGVDFVFADEAHTFRKLDFHTSQSIKGIDPNGSKRALDMYVKTRILEKSRPGRSFTFASGTPVTNTMGELYTIMRFFAGEELDKSGISTFDAWARQFGEVVAALEPNAAGAYQIVERFAKFDNVPELMSRVRQFMDVLTSDNLGALVKRPNIAGGKPNLNIIPTNEALTKYMKGELASRIVVSKAWKPTPAEKGNPDPIVSIITDGRFAAIDPRFFGGKLQEGESSIILEMGDKVVKTYHATKDNVYTDKDGKPEPIKGSTQIVFYNLGFGEGAQRSRGFDARAAFTKRLTDGGIPRNEIYWFDDANTDAKKEAVFKDMRSGKLKVLIGSAKKMGTGVNVQKRLAVLHYQDPPWYPADVEQPHGRIIRQGNQNETVAIEWYTTKGTYQSTMWQMVGRKQRFIDQAFTGDKTMRSMDDLGEASLFEQAAAVASGDPRAIQLAGLKQDVERFERLQAAHNSEQISVRVNLESAKRDIAWLQKRIEKLSKAFKAIDERYFSFTAGRVGKSDYTKLGEFGQAVKDAFNKVSADSLMNAALVQDHQIASLGDGILVKMDSSIGKDNKPDGKFDLFVEFGGTTLQIGNAAAMGADVDAVGLARRIVNQINSVSSDLTAARRDLIDEETNVTKLSKKLGAPFEHQQELAEKYGELKRLEAELKAEGEAQPDVPLVINQDGEIGSNASTVSQSQSADQSGATNLKQTGDFAGNETDVLFSQGLLTPTLKGPKPTPEQIERLVDKVQQVSANVIPITVIGHPGQIPGVQVPVGAKPTGALIQGRVYLFSDNIRSFGDAYVTLFHELFHLGLQKVIPAEDYAALLRKFARNPWVDRLVRKWKASPEGLEKAASMPSAAYDALAAEEALAMVSEELSSTHGIGSRKLPGLVKAVLSFLSDLADRLGFPPGVANWMRGLTQNEAEKFVTDMVRAAMGGENTLSRTKAKYGTQAAELTEQSRFNVGNSDADIRFSTMGQSAFARWFGDSKVVDKDGKPLVVYHGTDAEFNVFRPSSDGVYGPGAYMTMYDGDAATYGRNVMPVYVSLQNPYVATPGEARRAKKNGGTLEWSKSIQDRGHDGIILEDLSVVVAFRPEQIKSATGNNGQYDPTNPDIRFSTIGSVTKEALEVIKPFGKVSLWDKTIGTKYNLAQKDADFKRVFDAYTQQTDDTAHYAIESESQAPDVLMRLDSISDSFKALFKSTKQQSADLQAIAVPLFANIEGKTGVQQQRYSDEELATQFELTPKQIGMYHQVRASVNTSIERLAQTYAAQIGASNGMPVQQVKNYSLADTVAMVKTYIQEAHDEQRAAYALQQTLLQQDGADEAEFDETAALMRESRGNLPEPPSEEDTKALLDRLDGLESHARNLIEKGYMPAMRFGKYSVTVRGEDDEVVRFEMFESMSAANLAAIKLRKEYPDDTIEKSVMNPEQFAMFKGVSPETVELFAMFTGADQHESVKEYIALAKSQRSAKMRELKRKGTAGFSEDVTRVLASFITSNSRQAAINVNSTDINRALASRTLARKGDVQIEAQKLQKYMQDPLEEARGLRNFMFAYYMGGSLASAAVNLTQPVMQTTPYLHQFAGAKVGKIMAQAAKMAATQTIADSELKLAFERAKADGITEPHEIHQLMADASGSSLGGNLKVRSFLKLWGSFFAQSEAYNRRLTFLAAYMTAQQINEPDPYEFARNAVYETQGIYAKQNRPNWARGAVGATLFTFKQFSIAYIEFLNRLPVKQKALALTMLVIAAGLQGLPGADDLEDLIDTLGQSMGYNTNSKKALRQMLMATFGETLGEIINTGLLSKGPVDVQGRLGMGNFVPGTAVFKPSETDKSRTMAEFAGPLGGLLAKAQDAMRQVQRGRPGAAAETLLPVALSNLSKGIDMGATGAYKDSKGYKVEKVDGWDALAKAIGLQPSVIAKQSRQMSEEIQDVGMTRMMESAIADKWAQGIFQKDYKLVMEARRTLADWNKNNPGSRIVINQGQIQTRVRKMNQTREQRFLKTVPKEQRARVAAEMAG